MLTVPGNFDHWLGRKQQEQMNNHSKSSKLLRSSLKYTTWEEWPLHVNHVCQETNILRINLVNIITRFPL